MPPKHKTAVAAAPPTASTLGVDGKKKGEKAKPLTKSYRAGLKLSVSRTRAALEERRVAQRYGDLASVYATAILEYLLYEVIEMAGQCTQQNKRSTIKGRDILLSMRNDAELSKLSGNVSIVNAGVVPSLHAIAEPKEKRAPREAAPAVAKKPTTGISKKKKAAAAATTTKKTGGAKPRAQKKTNKKGGVAGGLESVDAFLEASA